VSDLVIAVDDPRADDVQALLERHLAFARSHTPPQDVHALDVVGLMSPAITLFSARRARQLLGVGALRHIDATHGEVKSMHTRDVARGQGVARSLLERVIDVARRRGYQRVSLETGAGDVFAPARSLYARAGFTPCDPFDTYAPSRNSVFMTLRLE
jgi:putative acetyltransferase